MPLFSEKPETGFIQRLPDDPAQQETVEPTMVELFGAAFAQENSLVSWASRGFSVGHDFERVDGYDPFEDIQGYELFAESFVESNSPEHTAHIKMLLDKEIQDRETLAAGGLPSIAAHMAAGFTDPIYLPFMLMGWGTVKGSMSAGQAFAVSAAVAGTTEIPAELAKHSTQLTRTGTETAINISGAALFSGVIGAGINKLSNRQFSQMAKAMDEVLTDQSPRSVGSAEVTSITMDELEVVGVGGLEKIGVSPNVRLVTSESKTSRLVGNQLMESGIVLKGAKAGKTAIPEGGSVETRMKMWDAPLAESIQEMDDLYYAYRGMRAPGAVDQILPVAQSRRIIGDAVTGRKGQLSMQEFRQEVGKAMRRGDAHDIPEVEQAAKAFRKKVFDPLKEAAIDERLLPADVDVSTATSYLMRAYNHNKILANRKEWDDILFNWLDGHRKANRFKLDEQVAAGKKPSDSLREQANITDAEIKEAIDSITDNITGNHAGRMPYDIKANVRGPLKERVLNIPDEMIEDFLESDIDLIARQYTKTMAADVELTRAFGSIDMDAEIQAIKAEWEPIIKSAKTAKKRLKLSNTMKRDVEDMEAVRDMLRGTYRVPENPNAFFYRAGRTLRDVNFVRMLGGMTMSAIPDLARTVSVNGLRPVGRGLRSLALSPKKFNMSRAEAKRAAVGLDMVLNSRASSLAEIADIYARGSTFERGLRAGSDMFSKMTLMSQWNSALKQFSGVITQDRILDAAVKWSQGKISKVAIKRLAASGIDEPMAKRIAAQFEQFGDTGDLLLSNGHLWDDKGALDTFRAAVLRDVDRTIVTPGVGEKPLWTSHEAGKMVFQFKTFAAVAHHKVMLADLQYRDAAALNGFLLMTALGGLTYGAKQYVAGREISTDTDKLIVESLDRSGAMGYFWDINNTVEKLSRGTVGVSPLMGAAPMSRYASRNWWGAALGPSLGTVQDIGMVAGGALSGEFGESELRAARKLLPGQNLFYMRRLLNELEEEVAKEL